MKHINLTYRFPFRGKNHMHAKIVWTLAYDKEPTQNTRLLLDWESLVA